MIISDTLKFLNDKDFGKVITFTDAAIEAFKLLLINKEKMMEIKKNSKTDDEKIDAAYEEYKLKTGKNLSKKEYLCIALNLA